MKNKSEETVQLVSIDYGKSSRAISWGNSFKVSEEVLPTTTTKAVSIIDGKNLVNEIRQFNEFTMSFKLKIKRNV